MGVRQALALFGDTKQAMGEEKSGPVETGLARPVAAALTLGMELAQLLQIIADGNHQASAIGLFVFYNLFPRLPVLDYTSVLCTIHLHPSSLTGQLLSLFLSTLH